MQTQVHFSGIREAVVGLIDAARHSVLVATAALSDRTLFDALVTARRRGLAVSLALCDDAANRESIIAWERLSAAGGSIFWIEAGSAHAAALQQRFCLIDGDSVVNGSFSWTPVASRSQENMILTQGDPAFAAQLRQAFARLSGEASPSVPGPLSGSSALSLHQDAALTDWRWQLRVLDNQLAALEAEAADMQRQIHLFDYEQEQAIGTLMRAYLDLRRRYLHALHARSAQERSAEQAEQAESVYQQYEQARSAMAQEPQPLPLDAQQQQDLKQLYRKLAMQCHPDRVGDQDKARAQELFQQLQLGYQNNDLARLAELQHAIGQRLAAAHSVAASDNAESLQRRLAQLQSTLAQREQELAQLRRGPVWQTLRAQPVWATWFDQRAQQLQTEIRRYEIELAQVSHA